MDNPVSWGVLALLTIIAGVLAVRYVMAEYDKYIYNRSHDWR